ncbi:GNAT family N-acetyltransferase [Yoonia sp. 2307UL14-13]|uniref:GNAT family N-acetyltransferase n=1 Tax=Yoonia sp. 2307UL14-13 TaxID=3126506 RepID=UPI0030AAE536
MTIPLCKGAYVARMAGGADDLLACQRLRHRCFFGGAGVDKDRFDALSQHVMVETEAGRLVATLRVALWPDGTAMLGGYAAQFYDLTRLSKATGPFAELGRFCVDPAVLDVDVLRIVWGAVTRLVDAAGARYLTGCTSFSGVDPTPYGPTFAFLRSRFGAPDDLRPGQKAPEVVTFDRARTTGGMRRMPPLLRTYLAMGGWVSDHAVVDRDLGTLHVFTCVPVAAIPAARAKALRAVAG